MDTHVQNVYLMEAVKQCRFGLNAHTGLENVLARLLAGSSSMEFDTRNTLQNEVFRSLHSLLTHASNVSRLFWPSPPRRHKGDSADKYRRRVAGHRASARAVRLRAVVGLAEEHPLKSREIRDHLEHFDERLDDWAETSVGKSIVQDLIGGPNATVGIADEDMMRWYDPTTHSLRFRGSQYAIRTIIDGLTEVYDACTRVLDSSGFGRSLKLIEWRPTPPVAASLRGVEADGAKRSGWLTAFASRILLDAPRLNSGALGR